MRQPRHRKYLWVHIPRRNKQNKHFSTLSRWWYWDLGHGALQVRQRWHRKRLSLTQQNNNDTGIFTTGDCRCCRCCSGGLENCSIFTNKAIFSENSYYKRKMCENRAIFSASIFTNKSKYLFNRAIFSENSCIFKNRAVFKWMCTPTPPQKNGTKKQFQQRQRTCLWNQFFILPLKVSVLVHLLLNVTINSLLRGEKQKNKIS